MHSPALCVRNILWTLRLMKLFPIRGNKPAAVKRETQLPVSVPENMTCWSYEVSTWQTWGPVSPGRTRGDGGALACVCAFAVCERTHTLSDCEGHKFLLLSLLLCTNYFSVKQTSLRERKQSVNLWKQCDGSVGCVCVCVSPGGCRELVCYWCVGGQCEKRKIITAWQYCLIITGLLLTALWSETDSSVSATDYEVLIKCSNTCRTPAEART